MSLRRIRAPVSALFYWTAAGLAFALLGIERIVLVALLGVLAVALRRGGV
jgi:hypothetical protein